jgi:hypothetical protein
MKKNILKSNSSFVVIGKSPAYSEVFEENGRVFSLAQAVNFDFSSNKTASKQLGYQNYSSNIDVLAPEVNLSIDYYFSPYLNNELLMGFRNASDTDFAENSNAFAMSKFRDKNYNFYFFSNERDGVDGFDEVKKISAVQDWAQGEVVSFGNCYLANYSLSMALGQVPVVSAKFKSSNISVETLTSNGTTKAFIQVPALDPQSGKLDGFRTYDYRSLKIDGGNISGDAEARNDLNPPVALPHKSSVSITNTSSNSASLSPLRNFSSLALQSLNINFDFDRADLFKFGSNSVSDRKLKFPVVANIQIESLVSGFNSTELNSTGLLGSATTNNKEELYDVDFVFSNSADSVTGFYNFQGAKLNSLNYSTQINEIYKVSASFSVEITESKGFLMSGTSIFKDPFAYWETNTNTWASEDRIWSLS